MSSSNTHIVLENVPWNYDDVRLSFEEVRVQDYLNAYIATGRPPAPCPPHPTDEAARTAMGLPPLFKPAIVEANAFPGEGSGEPPHPQVWEATKMDQETYHFLTAQEKYSKWSFEELRVQAILKGSGHLYVPPTASNPSTSSSSLPTPDPREKILNISARSGYEQHSQEEHRIAYMLSKREMTSTEIMRMQGNQTTVPPAAAATIPPPTPAVGLGVNSGSLGSWLGHSRSMPLPQTTSVGAAGSGSLFGTTKSSRPW